MTSHHRFHPQLHERITTVAALFPGSKVELLVLDEGTVMVECLQGACHCSALLDDTGRRALIVALGGLPMDNAMAMVAELETEAEAAQDRVAEGVAQGLVAAITEAIGQLEDPVTPPDLLDLARELRAAIGQ